MKNILLSLKRVIIAIAVVVLIFAVFILVLISFSPIKTFQVFRIMSGSMEPKIKTGSAVVIKQVNPKELKIGDVITYSINSPISPVTHRIVKEIKTKSALTFITKGDANKTNDVDPVNELNVKGKVIFSVPYLGYISAWTKTPLGFLFLIVLPALLIIINEIFNIRRTVKDEIKKKINETKMPIILTLFLVGGLINFMLIKPTSAFFSNGLILSGNVFSTGYWLNPTLLLSKLNTAPVLTLTKSDDGKFLTFKITGVSAYNSLSYTLTYDTDTVPEGVIGNDAVSGQIYTSSPITLGSCSSGGICVYNTGIKNIILTVTLSGSGGSTKVLTGSL